jgi:hypothetical protein
MSRWANADGFRQSLYLAGAAQGLPRWCMKRRSTTSTAGRPPELPHERDESADAPNQDLRAVARQGEQDLRRGLKDTSRKPEADAAYEMQKGVGAPGTSTAAPDASGAGQRKTDAGQGPGERRHASATRPARKPG